MDKAYKFIILTMTFAFTMFAKAQQSKSSDYYVAIKNYNLSKADSIITEGYREKISFPEPLGYIGENYQRFYIHYASVTKSKDNPYEYKVYGKTKVKDNICSFSGTITILNAKLYKESDDPHYKQGSIICRVIFYEDSTQKASGYIKGKLTNDFYIDRKGKIHYDALMFAADGYYNNQCEASWTSYKTNKSKKCNWGDIRMPDSKELDSGAGDVVISERFIKNGWESFVAAYNADEVGSSKSTTNGKSKMVGVRKTVANKSIANSGAGRWSNRLHLTISFGSGRRNSF